MDVSPLPAARAAAPAASPAASPTTGMEDFEKETLGGAPPPSRRGLSFGDLLDAVNPLQHIPVLSSLYRNLTGDEISPAARVAGGLIYGGPAGALIAGVTAGVEEASGGDLLGSAVAMLTGESGGESDTAPQAEAVQMAAAAPEPAAPESAVPEPAKRKPAVRSAAAAAQPAEPAAQAAATQAAPAAQPVSLAMAVDAPARSGLRGKDIRAYIAESMPAGMPARMPGRAPSWTPGRTPDATTVVPQPALPLPPRGAQAAAQKDIPELPGWFAERMLGGLDKYRAAAGANLAAANLPAAGSSVDERR